jgi:hypothetical protein
MSSKSVLTLSPQETYNFVVNTIACGDVPYVSGPPAIGKSQVVAQVAEDANALMIDIRLSQILPEDMTGLPERDEKIGKAKYLPFDMFPLEGDEIPDGYSGWIIFLDELSSASEEVLAAAYSLILDKTVGGKKLHPKVRIVAAGNRASDSAIARELPDTLITRMLPIQMKVSTNDWLNWADALPETKKNESVVGFIKKNPGLLYSPVKAKDRQELETFPTPRGWEKVFRQMNLHEKRAQAEASSKPAKIIQDANGMPMKEMTEGASKPIETDIYHMIAASVGSAAARAFREEYNEAIQLPYPWEVAQSPSSTRVPTTTIGKAKLTSELAKFYLESADQTRDNVLQYMNRIGGEHAALFLQTIKEDLGNTPSDQRLLDTVAKRLSIDPLLNMGTKAQVKGAGPGGQTNPF